MKSLISGRYQKSEKTAMGEVFDFLKKYDDDVIAVADKLDIGKSTIYKMIQQKEILV